MFLSPVLSITGASGFYDGHSGAHTTSPHASLDIDGAKPACPRWIFALPGKVPATPMDAIAIALLHGLGISSCFMSKVWTKFVLLNVHVIRLPPLLCPLRVVAKVVSSALSIQQHYTASLEPGQAMGSSRPL